MTLDRYLCKDCRQNLQRAGLIFKKMPGLEGSEERCAWCKRPCAGSVYRIKYGRK